MEDTKIVIVDAMMIVVVGFCLCTIVGMIRSLLTKRMPDFKLQAAEAAMTTGMLLVGRKSAALASEAAGVVIV
jgi:hypothetical protein